jgi:CTD kinase subunit beta
VEQDRQRILSVERYILENICFNFTSRMPFPYVIKIGRQLQGMWSRYHLFSLLNDRIKAPKALIKLAWRLAVDAQRTLAPLVYPPHEIALACLYVGAFLASLHETLSQNVSTSARTEASVATGARTRTPPEIAMILSTSGFWEEQFHAYAEDIDGW